MVNKWLAVAGIAFLIYLVGTMFLGLGQFGVMPGVNLVVLIVAVLAGLKAFTNNKYTKAWFFSKKVNTYIAVIGVAWIVLSTGVLGLPQILPITPASILGGIPVASLTTVAPSTTTQAGCTVSPELLGKDSSANVNAWDQEANAPFASAVDFTTNCWVYKNGNSATDYISTTSDTAAGTESTGFTVGDTLNMYCGGTTYYGEKVENFCVASQDTDIDINAHTIAGETEIQLLVYDDTGSSVLSAADNASLGDYNISLGASEEKIVFVKLTVNVANKAYNLLGFATVAYGDIKSVKPTDSAFVSGVTVNHHNNVIVSGNDVGGAMTNITTDYNPYMLSSPVMFSEWDFQKYQFTIKNSATDSTWTADAFSTSDMAIICVQDATYARRGDGGVSLDYHDHAVDSEADVGLAETETWPVGKNSCVVLVGI